MKKMAFPGGKAVMPGSNSGVASVEIRLQVIKGYRLNISKLLQTN
jgi:hypothetical protein